MRIAVIDDEKYSRVALVRQIESFLPHAEIAEAGSGAQAVCGVIIIFGASVSGQSGGMGSLVSTSIAAPESLPL